jgi:hypothetical protein
MNGFAWKFKATAKNTAATARHKAARGINNEELIMKNEK